MHAHSHTHMHTHTRTRTHAHTHTHTRVVLTFQIEVNESCVVLHVVGDLTLVAAVVGQRDVVDDEGGVAGPRPLQGHAVSVRAEHPLLPGTHAALSSLPPRGL